MLDLGAPVAVRLLYRTAYLSDGELEFRPDVYGWDDQLAALMGLELTGARTPEAAAAPLFGP